MPNRPHIDLGPLLSYLSGNQSLQSNPAYGATEPGQVDYSYTGDPSEAITKFGSSSPFIKPSALQAYGNPQLMADYNKFQYAPVKAEQERTFQDLATRSGTDTHKALWKANVYDNNPALQSLPFDTAYAQFGASPQVNFTQTNPNTTASTFASQGGPENIGLNNALLARRDYQQNTLADMLGTPGTETLGRDATARYGLDKTQADISTLPLQTDVTRASLGNSLAAQRENVPAQQALDLNRIRATIGNLPLENQATTLGLQNRIFEGTHGMPLSQVSGAPKLPTLAGGSVNFSDNPVYDSPLVRQFNEYKKAASLFSGNTNNPIEQAAYGNSSLVPPKLPSIPIDGAPHSTSVHLPGVATGTNQVITPKVGTPTAQVKSELDRYVDNPIERELSSFTPEHIAQLDNQLEQKIAAIQGDSDFGRGQSLVWSNYQEVQAKNAAISKLLAARQALRGRLNAGLKPL